MKKQIILAAAALTLSACNTLGGAGEGFSPYYAAVPAKEVRVGNGAMLVTPARPWNKQRRAIILNEVPWVEDWTLNGPLLDSIMFVSGLPNNRAIVRQRRTDDQQVPVFRPNMTAPEIVSMLESAYRVRGGAVDFKMLSLTPRRFMGFEGFQLDFEHLDGDEVWRKGRAVGAVIDGRLYLIMLDAARSHYYADTLRDFEALVASARLRR